MKKKIVFTRTKSTRCVSHMLAVLHPAAVHIEGIVLSGVTHSRTDKEYSFQVGNSYKDPISFQSILEQTSDTHTKTISAI